MRLSIFLFLAFVFAAQAKTFSQSANLTLNMSKVRLIDVLNEIEEQTDYYFYFNLNLDNYQVGQVKVENQDIKNVLNTILKDLDLTYEIVDRYIVIKQADEGERSLGQSQQQKTVTGKVTDSSGAPLPGVSVVVKGTTQGIITDNNGNYSLANVPADATLMFSFVGMKSQDVVVSGKSVINLTMQEETIGVDEVVVTALGIKREVKALGFSAQEVGSEDLSASRETELTSYLTGKVAGVQVSRTAAGTGGSTNVVIRGYKSFAQDNQPLYVVDGVPIYNFSNSNPTNAVAYASIDYGDGVGDINPQDVESMNVLKGPAATALYGSRGSNGVIVITTKSGRNAHKGIGVEVNSGVTFEQISLIPKFQNKFGSGYNDEGYADQGWGTDINGVYYLWPDNGQLDSWGAPLDGRTLEPNWWTMPTDLTSSDIWSCPINEVIPMLPQPANNVRNFFNTGITYSNDVAITSSNDKTQMRLSIGNISTTGIVPNHEIKKRTVNFSGSTQVNKVLSFDGKFNYIRTEGNQRPLTGYSQNNPMYSLIQMTRNTPLDFVKKQYEITHTNIRYPGINYNPYYMVNEIKNHDFKDRVIGLVSATLKFNDWLSLMGRVGADYWSQIKENTWPIDPSSKNYDSRRGEMIQQFDRLLDVNADVMLTANKMVYESIHLSGVLGASIRSVREDWMEMTGKIFKSPNVYDMSNFNDVTVGSSLYQKEMQSVYFTGQVAYKNYLFLDVTGRNDWSSALGVNNQSFFYPSISSSFVFTDAMDIGKKILSFGKVRASWAQTGNDSSPYLTRAGYSLYATGFNGLPYASKSGTIPLFNLKNELTESVEFGADLRFLNNRINLDFTYYNGKTSNQILNLSISTASGYGNSVINAGKVQNSGIELTLGLTPVKINDFSWDINFNYAANHSKVIVLDGNIQTYPLIASSGGEPGLSNIEARVGEAYGNIIGYAYKRAPDGQKIVDTESGAYVRESKLSILGNITPDWIGGLNNTFSYKGFSLNVLLDFVEGGNVVSSTKYEMTRKGTGAWTVEGRRPQSRDDQGNPLPYTGILDGVVEITDASGNVTGYEKNTHAVPGMRYWGSRAWDGIGEEFVEDGSYISLREVMLNYKFKPSLLRKTPFSGLTLTAFGRNLAYLQNGMGYLGLSPESDPNTAPGATGIEALTNPSTRTYGFNIKLTF